MMRANAATKKMEPAPGADGPDLSPLRAMVGFNLHMLDLLQYQLFYEERRGDEGFSPGVLSILTVIRQNPGIRHGALADALLIQRPNLTTLINQLEEIGYVARRAARGDKRSVALHLTDNGARAVERMLAAMYDYDRRLIAGLSGGERKTLLALLQKLQDSVRARTKRA